MKKHQDDPVNFIAITKTGDRLASCSDDRCVLVYTTSNGEIERQVSRSTLPVRTVDFSPKGTYIASAGESEMKLESLLTFHSDGQIKLVLMMDPRQCNTIKAHDGPVRHLAYDPKDKYLVSLLLSSC